ncbi:hypothetical protein HHI36_000544 [Cryptolaemus montrouzieri]|uniref:Uncharacterized protein n=1 Tax=Cryptolaemus montrouzieri TaxID=559131 RepID=A0ABD2P5M5_9CUCU
MDLNIDFRDISPTLISLSESEYPSFCEEIGKGQYTELWNITTSSVTGECSQMSQSVFDNSNINIESQGSHDCDQITSNDMLLPSIIHNSQPRATNDIDSDDIVPMAEDNREPSRKRIITCDYRSDDIENQEGVEISPPKKRKTLRDPKIILKDQKRKHPRKPLAVTVESHALRMLISLKGKKYIINFGVWTDKDVEISYLDKCKRNQLPLELLDVTQEDLTH